MPPQWTECGTSGPVGAPAPQHAPTGPPSARGSATGPPTGGLSATEAGWRPWIASSATVQVTRERGEDRSALSSSIELILIWKGSPTNHSRVRGKYMKDMLVKH